MSASTEVAGPSCERCIYREAVTHLQAMRLIRVHYRQRAGQQYGVLTPTCTAHAIIRPVPFDGCGFNELKLPA